MIVLIGWYIRTKVEDSAIFRESQEESAHAGSTWDAIRRVFRTHPREVLTAMGLRVCENTLYYIVVTFSLTYLKVHLHVDTSTILGLMLLAHLVHAAMVLLFGWLSHVAAEQVRLLGPDRGVRCDWRRDQHGRSDNHV